MAKYATAGTFGKTLRDPNFWLPVLAAPVAGAAVTGVGMGVERLMDGVAKARAYKGMLELHPHLKQRDPAMIKRIHDTLYRTNPMMGKDPMVAGAWTDTIMESGGALGGASASHALLGAVKDLAQIRSHVSQAGRGESSLGRSMGSAAQRLVESGVARGKEMHEKETGLKAYEKKVKDEKAIMIQRDAAKAFSDAEKRLSNAGHLSPAGIDAIMQAVIQKHSSSETPGRRLIAACRD